MGNGGSVLEGWVLEAKYTLRMRTGSRSILTDEVWQSNGDRSTVRIVQ